MQNSRELQSCGANHNHDATFHSFQQRRHAGLYSGLRKDSGLGKVRQGANCEGLTLVEVMVGMLISVICLGTALQAYIGAVSVSVKARQVNAAIAEMQADAETIRQMSQDTTSPDCQGNYAQALMERVESSSEGTFAVDTSNVSTSNTDASTADLALNNDEVASNNLPENEVADEVTNEAAHDMTPAAQPSGNEVSQAAAIDTQQANSRTRRRRWWQRRRISARRLRRQPPALIQQTDRPANSPSSASPLPSASPSPAAMPLPSETLAPATVESPSDYRLQRTLEVDPAQDILKVSYDLSRPARRAQDQHTQPQAVGGAALRSENVQQEDAQQTAPRTTLAQLSFAVMPNAALLCP